MSTHRSLPPHIATHPCPGHPSLPLPPHAATLYHPFAMSSPAEASNMLTFHVKATGGSGDSKEGWTAALNRLARERAELDRTLTRGQSAATVPSAVAAERLQSAVTAASRHASLASPRAHDVHETSSRSPTADALPLPSPRMRAPAQDGAGQAAARGQSAFPPQAATRGQSAFPPQAAARGQSALGAHHTRHAHLAQLVSHWQAVGAARGHSAATGATRGQTLGAGREEEGGGDAEAGRAGGSEAPRMPTDSEAPPLPTLPGLLAWVEGPYAAPCQGVLYAEHAVLVAAGVGVTPMASILGSMMARARAAKAAAEAIGDPTAGSAASALAPLRRLDIVWVAGESESRRLGGGRTLALLPIGSPLTRSPPHRLPSHTLSSPSAATAFAWFIPLLKVRGSGLSPSAAPHHHPLPPRSPAPLCSASSRRRPRTRSCAPSSTCTSS